MKSGHARDLLAYTPMLHARLMAQESRYRDKYFQPTPAGLKDVPQFGLTYEERLDGRRDVDRPLTVQFCANDPDVLLEAAKYVQPFCDAVDLNLGCPQGIARSGHYGAFLQEHQDLVFKLISNLRDNLDIPVTAKIRILETKEKTLAYAKNVLAAGASIIAVHGRQRHQKGHETGLADWSAIRYLRDNLPPDTVIFANGNILRHEDIAECRKVTGADAVMSAEGNLYDPTIFGPHPPEQINDKEYFVGRDGRGGYRVDFVFRRYLSLIYEYAIKVPEPERSPLFSLSDPHEIVTKRTRDEPSTPPPAKKQKTGSEKKKEKQKKKGKNKDSSNRASDPNLGAMQPHLFHMLRPLIAVHTEVRDALAASRAGNMEAFELVLKLTEAAVKQGLLEYEANPAEFEIPEPSFDQKIDVDDLESSERASRLCKRPWFLCQSYVRPLPKEAFENGSLQLSKKEIRRREENKPKQVGGSTNIVGNRPAQDLGAGLTKDEVAAPTMVCG